jgi:hypothetical protein
MARRPVSEEHEHGVKGKRQCDRLIMLLQPFVVTARMQCDTLLLSDALRLLTLRNTTVADVCNQCRVSENEELLRRCKAGAAGVSTCQQAIPFKLRPPELPGCPAHIMFQDTGTAEKCCRHPQTLHAMCCRLCKRICEALALFLCAS